MERRPKLSQHEWNVLAFRCWTLPTAEERTPRLRRDHLHSQIRRCAPRGNRGTQASSPPSHVARRHVFDQQRRHYRRWSWRRRVHASSWLATLVFLSLFTGGCRSNWPNLYADARSKFDHSHLRGDQTEADQAVRLTDQGLRDSAQRDPIWSYKFRILKAEIIVFGHPDEALELLSVAPPPELAAGEFAGRRKITQGLAYTLHQDYTHASLSFQEAADTITNNNELTRLVLHDEA